MKIRDFEFVNDKQILKDFVNSYDWLKEAVAKDYKHLLDRKSHTYSDVILLYVKRHIIKPQRGTKKSAGYDIRSPFGFELLPGEDIKIPTGLKAYMLEDEFLDIRPRSGSGFKYFVRLANTTGVIDSDYYSNPENDGHIWIRIRNEGSKNWVVDAGDAVCQGIFQKYLITDTDSTNSDRVGGFGSTGK